MPPSRPAPTPTRARRRHRSRARERLLELLRASASHPTAAELHGTLAREFPKLSLGTVYRNLELLVDAGAIDAVPWAEGALRYDGNPRPHHHFICERCGQIRDLEIPVPAQLTAGLRRRYRLRARRVHIDFHGLCARCGRDRAARPGRPSERRPIPCPRSRGPRRTRT
jgi:Fe2+ or Zn2+ uptake regulation protein